MSEVLLHLGACGATLKISGFPNEANATKYGLGSRQLELFKRLIMIRAFDFSRAFLVVFFFIGFLLIATEGLEFISWSAVSIALGGSLVLATLFTCFDWLSRHFSLRALNVFILGSLLGYLFSLTFIACLNQLGEWTPSLLPHSKWISGIKFSLLMFGIYFGISLVSRASDEIYMSIPLVRFRFQNSKKKDLLIGRSALSDSSLLDLAGCGMLDHRLVIPRHIVKDLQNELNLHDEFARQGARRALDMIHSLEMLPRLNLRFYETDFPEVYDPQQKMIKIARNIDADILTSTSEHAPLTQIDDVRFINLQGLAESMRPQPIIGEITPIKICSQGQESSQGVGFLEDGSMVIINQAGDKIGQTVRCHITSIKRSLTGKVLVANIAESSATGLDVSGNTSLAGSAAPSSAHPLDPLTSLATPLVSSLTADMGATQPASLEEK